MAISSSGIIPFGMLLVVFEVIEIPPFTGWYNTNPFLFILFGFLLFYFVEFLITWHYKRSISNVSAMIENQPGKPKSLIKIPGEIQELYRSFDQKLAIYASEQTALFSDKKMFDSTLKNMNDGIFIVDENEIVTLINPSACRMFDVQHEDVINHTMAEALRNFKINELYDQCKSTKQQEMTSFEITPHKTYIQCIATPLDPELPDNILFLLQDLTRIRQLEIVRRDFVSNVSHELRTPLASLKLITETLQEGALTDPPAAKRFLEKMNGEIDNLTQLVEELLELSRIESGRVPLDKKWTNPLEIINDAKDRMLLQAERAGLEINIIAETGLPKIFIDPPRMEQVLVNLLHNSIKFTNPGGKIEIKAERVKNDIIFHVKDTGVGIPPKDLERIFERFYKTDRSRTERGTGLGLSISRHLVEAHHGRIWAESQPDLGSTFSFSIPIHQ